MYHRDNPPSASIHEEATNSTVMPVHVAVQQPGALRPEQAAEQPAGHRARPRQVVELERRRQGPHLQAAGRREVARRPALHGQGRRLHLRPADRQGRATSCAATRAARGTAMSKASRPTATTRSRSISSGRSRRSCRCSPRAIRRSIPAMCRRRRCAPSRSAPGPSSSSSSSRTRASRSRRNTDYWKKGRPYLDGIEFTIVPNRGDGDAELRVGPVRHHLPVGGDDPAAEGHQEPAAQRGVRGHLDEQQHQPDPQSRRAAVRQSRPAQGAGAGASTARPSSTSSTRAMPRSAAPCSRPRTACGACRTEMLAAVPGYGPDVAEEPRGGPRAS